DVELDLVVAGDGGQAGTELVGLRAALADDDAGTRCVHVDPEAVTGALDLDAADRGVGEATHDVVTDLPVLDHEAPVVTPIGEPPGLPVGGDAQAEAIRIDLLAHQSSPFSSSEADSSTSGSSSCAAPSSAASATAS